MRIDRILADILQWVGQVVWHREQKVKARPYERLQTWRLPGCGLLHRVIRPETLCPRDVGSYIFEPYRYGSTTKDIHFCCDHLDGMARPGAWRKGSIHTHRLTILLADHFVGQDGRYAAEELFSIDDDWQGFSSRRDVHVPCLLHAIALAVSVAINPYSFDYVREVDNAKSYCMRGNYTYTLRLPKPTGSVIARPFDGGRAIRINFD